MLRPIIFYLLYLKNKLCLRHIKQNGYNIIFSFPKSKISIGTGVCINSSFTSNMLGLYQRNIIIARYGGVITIGNNCGISGSTIYSTISISIGMNTRIGANCKIIDNDFHPLELEPRRKGLNKEYTKRVPIEIGQDCFIGMNSIILKGTKIGNNVIVGAGSVVHGSFPNNCIIAGNPAKIIKYINE